MSRLLTDDTTPVAESFTVETAAELAFEVVFTSSAKLCVTFPSIPRFFSSVSSSSSDDLSISSLPVLARSANLLLLTMTLR